MTHDRSSSQPYRGDEAAQRARLEALHDEKRKLDQEERALRADLAQWQRRQRQAARRLTAAGPGAGLRGNARRDRVDIAAIVLAVGGLPLLFFHVQWHRYILNDPTVIPAILWLGTPGLLATIIAWPHRTKARGGNTICEVALAIGVLVALVPLASLLLAWSGA